MKISEPDTLDELIADCADIPHSLCDCPEQVAQPGAAAPWHVDDVCLAQVFDLDAYI